MSLAFMLCKYSLTFPKSYCHWLHQQQVPQYGVVCTLLLIVVGLFAITGSLSKTQRQRDERGWWAGDFFVDSCPIDIDGTHWLR
jgi:hypothetical protein